MEVAALADDAALYSLTPLAEARAVAGPVPAGRVSVRVAGRLRRLPGKTKVVLCGPLLLLQLICPGLQRPRRRCGQVTPVRLAPDAAAVVHGRLAPAQLIHGPVPIADDKRRQLPQTLATSVRVAQPTSSGLLPGLPSALGSAPLEGEPSAVTNMETSHGL